MYRLTHFLFAATWSILFLGTHIDSVYGHCGQMEDAGLGVTVPCDKVFEPENCDFDKLKIVTVEDYERCVPATMNTSIRNYFLGASGRRVTYNDNKAAFNRYRILPELLRDVSETSLEVTTLKQKMAFPIGLAPIEGQNLAHPDGEIATVRGIKNMGIPFVLSSYGTATIEDVADEMKGGSSHLWMGTYFFQNKSFTESIVQRAAEAGYEAIVVTVDTPIPGRLTCDARFLFEDKEITNLPEETYQSVQLSKSVTTRDIRWLTKITELPIVVKGILTGYDAKRAVRAGASAIIVSNHGGRELDSDRATIDVLAEVVEAVMEVDDRVDVYMDGGVRNGWDIFKAIAMGAKMVFIGRPMIWGLAKSGDEGVKEVVTILKNEFEEAMTLAGSSKPSEIYTYNVGPA